MAKLDRILKSKSFYVVVSVLLGIVSWLLVLNYTNPNETRSLEIPLTILNPNAPSSYGLSNRTSSYPENITVKASGRSDIIGNLTVSDLYAAVDFSEITEPGTATLQVSEPECARLGIKIEDYYPKTIDFTFDQLTQRNVGPRALHPLVGGNILPNQNMLVRAGNRQRFFQKFAVIGLKFRVLHAGGILFQHKGFACRVKHLFAGARLVLCHLAHCLHTLFKQCGHLCIDLVNLRTGLLQLIHRQVPHIPWLFIFYYTIKRSVSQ